MCDKKYNGWTNWETWNANLWYTDGGLDEYMLEQLREQEDLELEDVARQIEEHFTEAFIYHWGDRSLDDLSGPIRDAIGIYITEVDWREIARHAIEEVQHERATA